jgi:hypothetical protein
MQGIDMRSKGSNNSTSLWCYDDPGCEQYFVNSRLRVASRLSPVEIDGEDHWDGGLPTYQSNLDEVAEREKNIRYSSRTQIFRSSMQQRWHLGINDAQDCFKCIAVAAADANKAGVRVFHLARGVAAEILQAYDQ